MKNRIPLAFKQAGSMSICSYPISACAVHTTSGSKKSNDTHETHTELFFLLPLFFCFSPSLFLFLRFLFYFVFCETQRKDS